ncbi:MAG: GNAT family N-acetyltransferase [Candidatus Saccharimonadales bacterium]
MSEFELVPITEVDVERTATDLHACLQEQETYRQLKRHLPGPLSYGESIEAAEQRLINNQEIAKEDSRFKPFVQLLGEHAIGIAVLDERLEAKRRRLMAGIYIGHITTTGPSTSSWIARPYQGRGYGRQSLEARIKIATVENGHDGLWTVVDTGNDVSRCNVMARGFVPLYTGGSWVGGQTFKDATVYQYLA